MRHMGKRAIYQNPSKIFSDSPSERFPCLVDLDMITSIDQVCATDITYIPQLKGFLYLVAIVELFSRNVLSWKLSNSLDTQFCMETLEMALASGSRPEIFHSDQGCQFTSADCVDRLHAEDTRSAGLSEGDGTTTSCWKGFGERIITKRFICVPTAMAGTQKLAWLDSYGGMAM
jgi:putative transposase